MDIKQRQHLMELRHIYQRRLDILHKQAASFGTYVPPHILIEIEDVKQKIVDIDLQSSDLDLTWQQTSKQKLIRILFLSSEPTDAARLRLGQELREIQETLQLAKLREQFDLHQRICVRPVDISQALLDTQPQIVHFSGHGTASGELCFENMVGETHAISFVALAALFEQFADQVNCVVLNACFSEIQANAIVQHISCVVGMSQELGDQAAIAFAIGFYQALGAGRTIDDAYKLGVVQIKLQGIPEHLTPVLLTKKNVQ